MNSSSRIRYSLAAAVALGLSLPIDVNAASDYLLVIEGIKGESQDKLTKNSFDIVSWSWGMTKTGSGQTCVEKLNFLKEQGSASPELGRSISEGTTHLGGTLLVNGRDPQTGASFLALEIRMQEVRLTSLQWSGTDGSGLPPTESYSLEFMSAEVNYYPPEDPLISFDTPVNKCK